MELTNHIILQLRWSNVHLMHHFGFNILFWTDANIEFLVKFIRHRERANEQIIKCVSFIKLWSIVQGLHRSGQRWRPFQNFEFHPKYKKIGMTMKTFKTRSDFNLIWNCLELQMKAIYDKYELKYQVPNGNDKIACNCWFNFIFLPKIRLLSTQIRNYSQFEIWTWNHNRNNICNHTMKIHHRPLRYIVNNTYYLINARQWLIKDSFINDRRKYSVNNNNGWANLPSSG